MKALATLLLVAVVSCLSSCACCKTKKSDCCEAKKKECCDAAKKDCCKH